MAKWILKSNDGFRKRFDAEDKDDALSKAFIIYYHLPNSQKRDSDFYIQDEHDENIEYIKKQGSTDEHTYDMDIISDKFLLRAMDQLYALKHPEHKRSLNDLNAEYIELLQTIDIVYREVKGHYRKDGNICLD